MGRVEAGVSPIIVFWSNTGQMGLMELRLAWFTREANGGCGYRDGGGFGALVRMPAVNKITTMQSMHASRLGSSKQDYDDAWHACHQ